MTEGGGMKQRRAGKLHVQARGGARREGATARAELIPHRDLVARQQAWAWGRSTRTPAAASCRPGRTTWAGSSGAAGSLDPGAAGGLDLGPAGSLDLGAVAATGFAGESSGSVAGSGPAGPGARS